jgi:hypothetical protein
VVLSGRARVHDGDGVQLLGESGGPISDCSADRAHVVCHAGDGLQIWAYRS